MASDGTGSAREEAERLVAAVLGAASVGAKGLGVRGPVATDSAECCVCPVCRVIAAMRDPEPEFAERVATGAGDLAAAVAGLLRSFTGPVRRDAAGGSTSDAGGAADRDDEPWRAATRDEPPPGPPPAPPPPRKPMAKKAVKRAAAPPPDEPAEAP